MRRASWRTLEDTLGTGCCRSEMGELLPFQLPPTTSRVCRATHLPRHTKPGMGWGARIRGRPHFGKCLLDGLFETGEGSRYHRMRGTGNVPLECLEPSPLPFLSHNPVEHIVGKLSR